MQEARSQFLHCPKHRGSLPSKTKSRSEGSDQRGPSVLSWSDRRGPSVLSWSDQRGPRWRRQRPSQRLQVRCCNEKGEKKSASRKWKKGVWKPLKTIFFWIPRSLAARTSRNRRQKRPRTTESEFKKQAYVDNMCKLAQEKKPMHFFYVLLQGRTAWIDDEASPEERQAALQAGLTAVTSSLDEANVAFVTNSSPEKRAFWHMMLRGGAVVARDFLTVKRHVFVLQYRSGIEIHLKLFMSDNFKAKHVQITACLQHHIHAEPTSKWEEIGQNQAKVVLCLENEKRSFSKPGVRVHTAESFLKVFWAFGYNDALDWQVWALRVMLLPGMMTASLLKKCVSQSSCTNSIVWLTEGHVQLWLHCCFCSAVLDQVVQNTALSIGNWNTKKFSGVPANMQT